MVRRRIGKGNRRLTLLLVGVVCICAWLALTRLPWTSDEYHPDEGVWIAAGNYYFQKYFLDRDWSHATWKRGAYGPFGRQYPQVGKYLIGASLHVSGVSERGAVFDGYEPENYSWEKVRERKPPSDALRAGRLLIVLLAVGSTALLFLVARELTGSWILALSAAALFMIRPIVLEHGRLAMIDMPALFFSLAALLVASRMLFVDFRHGRRMTMPRTIALGLTCGLALSTKMNTLLTLAVVCAWVMSLLFWISRQQGVQSDQSVDEPSCWSRAISTLRALGERKRMAVTFLAAIAALWFVTNPYLLHRPWKSIELLTFGRVVASYPESENRLDTLRPRIANLLHVGLVSSGGLDHWLGAHGADAVLIAAGAVLLGIQICSKKRGRWRRRRSLAFAMWAGITMAGIGWWAPFAWNRWYLPAEPCWAMLEAMGLCALALGAQSLLRISFRIVSGSAGNSRD